MTPMHAERCQRTHRERDDQADKERHDRTKIERNHRRHDENARAEDDHHDAPPRADAKGDAAASAADANANRFENSVAKSERLLGAARAPHRNGPPLFKRLSCKPMSESVRSVSRPGQSEPSDGGEKSRAVCVHSAHEAAPSLAPRDRALASAPRKVQEKALTQIVRADPDLMAILRAIRELELPDAWLTAGSVYQTVWNALTDMPHRYGINDYDVCYFDSADLSHESQSKTCARISSLVARKLESELNIEAVNQARVHLWFQEHFGFAVPPLEDTTASLPRYACTHHAVAVQLTSNGEMRSLHPFGLDDIFAMRIQPNRLLPNQETHRAKCARARALWPGVIIEDW